MESVPPSANVATGVQGLDHILGDDGLPKDCIYLVDGEPGSGKTTLALQFLIEGVKRGETCLYIGLSETKREIQNVGRSHGWDINRIHILDLFSIQEFSKDGHQNTLFQPGEVELNQTTKGLIDALIRLDPTRVVFDSVSEMRLLAGSSTRYRQQILELKYFFSTRRATVLFLDDLLSSSTEFQIKTIVHGVLSLETRNPDFGVELRRIKITKLRGVQFRGGYHDYAIRKGGLVVFPRVVAAEHNIQFVNGIVSSEITALDTLLGGGLNRGSSNLLLGPAGTGKSTIAIQYAFASASRGERVAFYVFEENITNLFTRSKAIGLDIEKFVKSGMIFLEKIDPAGKSPGEFTDQIRHQLETSGIRMVVIDSLNGYIHAMPQENYLLMQLHELLTYLAHHGVVTILVLAQQGLLGMMSTPIDLTYLADTVLITRYFEAHGAVKKAISVIKKRMGPHESTIRELKIDKGGVWVGPVLDQFQGVLTGVPMAQVSKKMEPV